MRPALVSIHRWIGLLFGVLLILQGLTGATLVYREELSHAIHAGALTVDPEGPRRPVQELLDKVRAAHPESKVLRIEYPAAADQAFVFRLEDRADKALRFVAVDPYRGVVTRDGGLSAWPVEWVFDLHHELLAGENGSTFVGIMGIGLLFICLTGPFIWWPGRFRLREGFAVTLKGGTYRSLRDLHRVGGIATVAILALIAGTGVLMVWKVELQPQVTRVVPMIAKPAPKVAARDDAELLPVDRLVTMARARYDGATVRTVRYPGGTGRVATVFLEADSHPRPRASNQVWLDGYTGEVLGTYEAASLPPGNGFFDWMLPIHSGEAFGPAGRLLFLLAGLALSGFAVSGFWMWLSRRSAAAGATPAPRQTIQVRIARVWKETPAIRALELRAADGGLLPPHAAGAHVDLTLPNGLVRQYSIWSDASDRSRYCIAVLRETDSRGGSAAVHELAEDDLLRIGAPRNMFPLVEDAPFTLLVAGGIGVTPLLAMATRLHALGRPFAFHYCARTRADAAFLDRIERSGWSDRASFHFGDAGPGSRFDSRATLAAAPTGTHVYACGPARLIDDVLTTGRALGLAEHALHAELFQASRAPDPDARPFDVQLARSGRTLHIPPDRSVADVLADGGIRLPLSCGQGICGSCRTGFVDGTPEHRDHCLTDEERKHLFTPCCSRARTPVLVLDL